MSEVQSVRVQERGGWGWELKGKEEKRRDRQTDRKTDSEKKG